LSVPGAAATGCVCLHINRRPSSHPESITSAIDRQLKSTDVGTCLERLHFLLRRLKKACAADDELQFLHQFLHQLVSFISFLIFRPTASCSILVLSGSVGFRSTVGASLRPVTRRSARVRGVLKNLCNQENKRNYSARTTCRQTGGKIIARKI
jgi:site-specific recombinase